MAKVLEFQLQHQSYSGLISFRMDWLDLLAVQGTLKSLIQNHSSKASNLWQSAFFIVQPSHPYMTTRKTIDTSVLENRRLWAGMHFYTYKHMHMLTPQDPGIEWDHYLRYDGELRHLWGWDIWAKATVMGNLAIKMRQWKKREEFNKEKGLKVWMERGEWLCVQNLGRCAGDWREW